jgi:hypothetical protein
VWTWLDEEIAALAKRSGLSKSRYCRAILKLAYEKQLIVSENTQIVSSGQLGGTSVPAAKKLGSKLASALIPKADQTSASKSLRGQRAADPKDWRQ